ncbi:MAG: fibronectin type III domain-containing protein [Candidatus Saccharimonadales bacterium]
MNQWTKPKRTGVSGKMGLVLAVALVCMASVAQPQSASAAACSAPSTDYGSVTGLSVSAGKTANYRIWTRMAAQDSTNNTYLLEVDGVNCFVVGGSGVPVYSTGTSTYFVNSTANWINKTSTGAVISLSLSAGTHTLKLIGNTPGVVVDRVILTASTTCIPTGTGGNCFDAIAPVISNAKSTSVTHNSAVVSWTTNEPASTQVEYGTTAAYGTTTTLAPQLVTSHSSTLTSLSPGTLYHYRVISSDEAGSMISSNDATFTTASIPGYAVSDINKDGVTGILDVSMLAKRWGQSGSSLGRSDINSDGIVDALDLSLLIANYGK